MDVMTGVRLTEFWPFRKDGTHWHLQALCFMQKGLDQSTGCVYTTPQNILFTVGSRGVR